MGRSPATGTAAGKKTLALPPSGGGILSRLARSPHVAVPMPNGSYSLEDVARHRSMLKLACEACGRRGQYRVDRLLERFPPDITLPDLRHELAQCLRRGSMSEPCQMGYLDLSKAANPVGLHRDGPFA